MDSCDGDGRDHVSLLDRIDGARNILVLAPTIGSADSELCADLLQVTDPTQENILGLTFTSVDRRLDTWQTRLDELPAELQFISVGDQMRSAAEQAGTETRPGLPSIETVSSPADLTGIGIAVTKALEQWQGNGNQTVICFHTLTTLLQYADIEITYRFLHVLTSRMESTGAVAHYHLDPTAHDRQTINTLLSLYDAVVEADDDGDIRVRTH